MLGFRVWDKESNEMFDGFPFLVMNPNGKLLSLEGLYPKDVSDDYIPMQSTGIEDDSGKTIYEGDFLTVFLRERSPHGEAKIERNHKSFLVKDVKDFLGHAPNFYWPHETVMKIIGNKYQNANLLENLK
jgi:uncharacterized phage protein (TIGR01671 family)